MICNLKTDKVYACRLSVKCIQCNEPRGHPLTWLFLTDINSGASTAVYLLAIFKEALPRLNNHRHR